jgi:hypothetical protein
VIQADPGLQQREGRGMRERALARYPKAMELFRVG